MAEKKPKKIVSNQNLLVPDKQKKVGIYFIRGHYVMLDMDLAQLYNVETKQLKRQVRRNKDRFPDDFMFELTKDEFEDLRSQFGTSSWRATRYMPMAFTEHGVAMLSSVLNNDEAIRINIMIMRAFTKYRKALSEHAELRKEIERLDRKVDAVSVALLKRIDELRPKFKEIGFKR